MIENASPIWGQPGWQTTSKRPPYELGLLSSCLPVNTGPAMPLGCSSRDITLPALFQDSRDAPVETKNEEKMCCSPNDR